MGEYKTKYNIGDFVWGVSIVTRNKKTTCEVCNGEGVVALQGVDFECPACHGEMYFSSYQRVAEVIRCEIGEIHIKVRPNETSVSCACIRIIDGERCLGDVRMISEDMMFDSLHDAVQKAQTLGKDV